MTPPTLLLPLQLSLALLPSRQDRQWLITVQQQQTNTFLSHWSCPITSAEFPYSYFSWQVHLSMENEAVFQSTGRGCYNLKVYLWANTWLSQGEKEGGSGVLLNTAGFLSITLPLCIGFDAAINGIGSVHICACLCLTLLCKYQWECWSGYTHFFCQFLTGN